MTDLASSEMNARTKQRGLSPLSGAEGELPRNEHGYIKAELPRLRVAYAKDDRLAYLSHLEVAATVERAVRRARLPFSVGNGFARRVRMQFSQSLPTGASSAAEYYDVRLTRHMDPKEALAALVAATPAALAPFAAGYADGHAPALEAWLDRGLWRVELLGSDVAADALSAALSDLRAQGSLLYLRQGKEKRVDLARTLVGFEVAPGERGPVLTLDERADTRAALRPRPLVECALAAAGLPLPDALRVRRLAQWHEGPGGTRVEAL